MDQLQGRTDGTTDVTRTYNKSPIELIVYLYLKSMKILMAAGGEQFHLTEAEELHEPGWDQCVQRE